MNSYDQLIKESDLLVREGRDAKVAKLVGKLNTAKVPRKFRLPLANICLRVGLNPQGLRLLAPVIRARNGRAEPALPREKAEYAILLQRHGAVDEALTLLDEINSDEVPESLLYASFCHFNVWDYERALPLLERYLRYPLEPYPRLIGNLNLAAALVTTGRLGQAEEHLRTLIEEARRGRHIRIEGNCRELLAQAQIFAERFTEAEAEIEAAQAIFQNNVGLENLFVGLYRSFLEARKTSSLVPLKEFRSKAAAWPHPETVREADLLALLIRFDQKEFDHLMFGTPYPSYRERVLRILGGEQRSSNYLVGRPSDPVFDVLDGTFDGNVIFQTDSIPHRVIQSLARDLYRPVRLCGLFAGIFPGTYFDIFSSPDRVHQELRRTRRSLEDHAIPLNIREDKGAYSLHINGDVALRVPYERRQLDSYRGFLDKLHSSFGNGQAFTARETQQVLGLSPSASHRFLRRAIENAHVEKFGASAATTYTLKPFR